MVLRWLVTDVFWLSMKSFMLLKRVARDCAWFSSCWRLASLSGPAVNALRAEKKSSRPLPRLVESVPMTFSSELRYWLLMP
ncbi:hypothetical protein D3C76_1228710 [compost metagenome]